MKEIEKELFYRPVKYGDDPILFRLFVEGRGLILPPALNKSQKELILMQQFAAFERQMSILYPEREKYLILRDGSIIGEWQTNRSEAELHLVSITLFPTWRGHGTGSALIRHLQQEAGSLSLPLTLSVACDNTPAISLYHKLGFKILEEKSPYIKMSWRA